ncbi:hypothetical protein RhiirA5_444199 [Rhizophagus irregularis]|uniref:Uncharacterized protein n=1 Tax=Rhizophagus irregularis TaxID=588596 RepID=A0A2N0NDB3_9GLOM|nr:hypothetical protein RhiirA5_444199 [Rhizophagus irregularis]
MRIQELRLKSSKSRHDFYLVIHVVDLILIEAFYELIQLYYSKVLYYHEDEVPDNKRYES